MRVIPATALNVRPLAISSLTRRTRLFFFDFRGREIIDDGRRDQLRWFNSRQRRSLLEMVDDRLRQIQRPRIVDCDPASATSAATEIRCRPCEISVGQDSLDCHAVEISAFVFHFGARPLRCLFGPTTPANCPPVVDPSPPKAAT